MAKDDFSDIIDRRLAKRKQGIKERYHLAKELGFSVHEAGYLCQWSKRRIVELAVTRGHRVPPGILAEIQRDNQGVQSGT